MWLLIIIFSVATAALLAKWLTKADNLDFGKKLAAFYDAIKYYPSWFKNTENNNQEWDTGLVNLKNLKKSEIRDSWVEIFLSAGNEANGEFLDFNFSVKEMEYNLVFLEGCKKEVSWRVIGENLEYRFPCSIVQDKKTVVFKAYIHETGDMWTTYYSCVPDVISKPRPWFYWLSKFMGEFLSLNKQLTESNLKKFKQEYKEVNKNKI